MSFSSTVKLGAKVFGLGLWASVCYFGTNAILSAKFNKKPEIETIWENAKKEFETYKEIKSEGIQADSYKEGSKRKAGFNKSRPII